MKKATIISTCLVNSGMFDRLEYADNAVRQIFEDEFPAADFEQWNVDLDDQAAKNITQAVGSASMINVRNFIKDLSR